MKALSFILCCLATSLFAKPLIFVAIVGGTGSGKTTLAQNIHQMFPNSVLISQDSYYRDLSHLPLEKRGNTNFDHPNSLEFSLLQEHLLTLKNGCGIQRPNYNFHLHIREKTSKWIEPAEIILVEGILLLTNPELRNLFDIKIFVDTDDDVRLLRRIERDMKERSRHFSSIKEQYLSTVKPMHDAFVFPSKKYADVIFPGGGNNQIAISLILAKLNAELCRQ
jgi:uridine kinase